MNNCLTENIGRGLILSNLLGSGKIDIPQKHTYLVIVLIQISDRVNQLRCIISRDVQGLYVH